MAGSTFQINGLGSGVDTASILDTMRTFRMRPATLEKNKQNAYIAKKSAWMDLNVRLLAVQTTAQALSRASAFSATRATSSDEGVASITVAGETVPGSVSLNVGQLAGARKVVSSAVTGIAGSQAALGWSGAFSVNGKSVNVSADDSLDSIASKINGLRAGASASVIQVSPGSFKMTVAGAQTGRQDALSLADVRGGDILSARLGILGATTQARYATGTSGDVASSLAFSGSADATLASLLPGAPAATGTFTLGAAAPISYDTAADTLTTLAAKINAAAAGAGATFSAAVVSDGSDSSKKRLQITGVTGPDFGADADNLLGALGVTQKQIAAGNELTAAQDAVFTLDNNLTITRPVNTVSDVLSGVTIMLKKSGPSATTTLTTAQDTQAAADGVNNFVKAYNDAMGKIQAQTVYTPGAASPPLFGDFTLQRVQEELADSLNTAVSGQPPGFATLRDVGITLGGDGKLGVDAAALNAALGKDSAAVSRLFTAWGSADDPAVTYLSSSSDTRVSAAGYAVNVTAAAERARVSGAAPAAPTSAGTETLSFSGSLFPAAKAVTLNAGNTLTQTVNQINSSEAGKLVVAYDDAGKLGLRSINYGSGQSFSAVSDKAAGAGYSGVGTTGLFAVGTDVAGTIGGETAQGKGRTLTGNQAGGAANGLAVQVTAGAPGGFGKVTVQRGAAATVVGVVSRLTDLFSGTIQQEQNTLDARLASSQQAVTDITARVDAYIDNMQRQFTRMETQISRFKSQSAQLAQTIAGLNKSNKDG